MLPASLVLNRHFILYSKYFLEASKIPGIFRVFFIGCFVFGITYAISEPNCWSLGLLVVLGQY